MKKIILITGSAGFIGFHVVKKLLSNPKNEIVGIDNINHYYSPKLKKSRLGILKKFRNFKFYKGDISNNLFVERIFKKYRFHTVINLAAQAGVRHSLKNPRDYVNSNLIGFFNIINASKKYKVSKFLFASTSSVYGNSTQKFFKENNPSNHQIQFYAATKKSNEVMAHSYAYTSNMQIIGLRFFTVYGPWGRPDMVLFRFVNNIINNKFIELYNKGDHYRDFTYIDDVVDIIFKLSKVKLKKKNSSKLINGSSKKKFEIFNVSSGRKVHLKKFLKIIEKNLKKKAKIKLLPMQIGDVYQTISSRKKLKKFIRLRKSKSVDYGVEKFIQWYLNYHNVK
jgi:UDP-glucuronate 4-epimerase